MERSGPHASGVVITVLVENQANEPRLANEHGLSLWIETPGGKILFDTGQSDAFARNADALGIDLGTADAIVISHGHYDHAGGLERALAICDAPVYAGPAATIPKVKEDNGRLRDIGMESDLVRTLGPRLRTVRARQEIVPGVVVLPAAEVVEPLPSDNERLLRRDNGSAERDSFEDELSLLLRTGSGPVLVTGCSHRGIANIARDAADRLRAIVGGLHLMHESETTVRAAARGIASNGDYWVGHCTGTEALLVLEEELPGRVHGIPAGTTVQF